MRTVIANGPRRRGWQLTPVLPGHRASDARSLRRSHRHFRLIDRPIRSATPAIASRRWPSGGTSTPTAPRAGPWTLHLATHYTARRDRAARAHRPAVPGRAAQPPETGDADRQG